MRATEIFFNRLGEEIEKKWHSSLGDNSVNEDSQILKTYQQEIEKLKAENKELEIENADLKKQLANLKAAGLTCSVDAKKIFTPYITQLKDSFLPKKNITSDILWDYICSIDSIKQKVNKVTPNRFSGGFNMKLFLNICGLLKNEGLYTLTNGKIAKVVRNNDNDRVYMRDYSTDDSEMTKEEIRMIKDFIEKHDSFQS